MANNNNKRKNKNNNNNIISSLNKDINNCYYSSTTLNNYGILESAIEMLDMAMKTENTELFKIPKPLQTFPIKGSEFENIIIPLQLKYTFKEEDEETEEKEYIFIKKEERLIRPIQWSVKPITTSSKKLKLNNNDNNNNNNRDINIPVLCSNNT